MHPPQSPPDNEESSETYGQSCGQTYVQTQKEAKKDQLGTPESYYQAYKKEEGTYSTETSPKIYISQSTDSTAEPDEPENPTLEATHKPGGVEKYHKGEEDNYGNINYGSKTWRKAYDQEQAKWIQQKQDREEAEKKRRKNKIERGIPELVRKQIDLTQVSPYTPYSVRNQWDGTWKGLHDCGRLWRKDLDISKEMVKEAESVMGDDGVAIAMLITLWKDDLQMIRKNPSAYFWGVTKKVRSGNLNLPKTIYSLQNRNKYG